MKGRRVSLFTQFFVAATVPLVCFLGLLLLTIHNVIQKEMETFAKETTHTFTDQLAIRIEQMFATLPAVLTVTRKNLEDMDFSAPEATRKAENMLTAMLTSIPGIHSVWFVFEEGVFFPDKRFIKSFVDDKGILLESRDITDDVLNDPALSPWYDIPIRNGISYFSTVTPWGYGLGHGTIYTGTISFPLKKNGNIIGCVGLDLQYEKLLSAISDLDIVTEERNIHLITGDGAVVYSTAPEFFAMEKGEPGGKRPILLADNKQIAKALREKKAQAFYAQVPETGQKRFVCLSPLIMATASRQLLLYIDVPAEVLLAKANRPLWTIGAICLGAFILLAASLLLATRSVVRPINDITGKAHALAEGRRDVNFDDVPEGATWNEVTLMANALKKMFEELVQLHDLKIRAVASDFERQKLEAAAMAKANFFASMSHEIRTPMNAVLGLAELLLNDPLSESQHRHVQDIKMSADALLKIINDILDSSKMEAGRLELVSRHYSFPLMLDNICSIIRLMAEEKGLEFTFELRGEMPYCLYGDPERLRQILLNILNNAVKYTETGFVRIRLTAEDVTLIFEVEDSGIGVRKETLPILFDPYSRADSNDSKVIEGTGLGLSITKRLVEMMGGEIVVASEYGKGSTFTVRLPFVLGNPDKLEEEMLDMPVSAIWKAHALVVDDNRLNLNVARGLLTLYGVTCDLATSGKQALQMVQDTYYDLIFMDHMMPGMDGLQTTALLRETMGGKLPPVIALTANAMPSTKNLLLNKGMDDFIAKPIQIHLLRAALAKWLPESASAARQPEAGPPQAAVRHTGTRPKADPLSALLQEAGKIPGFNLLLALARVGGQRDVLETSLRLFSEDLNSTLQRINTFFAEQNAKALHLEAHALKGALANIGATALSARANSLEKAAREANFGYWKIHFPSFLYHLVKFGGRLEALFKQQSQGAKPAGDQAQREILENDLAVAMEAYDYDTANEILQQLTSCIYGPEHDKRIKRVKSYLDRFSYDEALAALRNEDSNKVA